VTQGARRRLALVTPNLAGGGGVQAVARFIRHVVIRSGRFELQVVSLSESARDPVSLRLSSPPSWVHGPTSVPGDWEGVPFIHVGAVASELEFQRYRPRHVLTRILAGCDMIQVVCGFPAWANAVLGTGKPVALHVATRARIERRQRDARPRSLAAGWRRAMTSVTDRLDDSALRGVDAIQVMNPWMLEYARALNTGRAVDLRFLPPGVNLGDFHPLADRAPGQDAYILCVARLSDPRKNIGLLLEAFAKLPESVRGNTRLVLAGSSAPPAAVWQRAGVLGIRERVTFVERPDQDALVRLYQGASVFALPSDEEGFGMVLLEAMACGVPVVSTRSGGPDGIITDGVDGYLVPLDDAPALSDRLARLLQDSTRNIDMGRRARQTIEERYDERVAGEAFIDVWDRLARKAGAT